jgi:hypothetical protein
LSGIAIFGVLLPDLPAIQYRPRGPHPVHGVIALNAVAHCGAAMNL